MLDIKEQVILLGDMDTGNLRSCRYSGETGELLAILLPQHIIGVTVGILGNPEITVLVGKKPVRVGNTVYIANIGKT